MKGVRQIKGLDNYFINHLGQVYKVTGDKCKEVGTYYHKASKFVRANVYINGKGTLITVHMEVYRAFKGEPVGEVVFLDGDKNNCRLDNLIDSQDLVDFYVQNNYAKIPHSVRHIEGYSNYVINSFGEVYKVGKDKLVRVAENIDKGFLRVNLRENGKSSTGRIHTLVYRAFKGDFTGENDGKMIFLDGNRVNCDINNLVTTQELVDFYLKNK